MQESEQNRCRCRFFDESARDWENRNYPADVMDRTEQMIAGLNFSGCQTILDVGCGRGIVIPMLRKMAGADARLIALDASAPMLEGVAAKDPQALAIHARAENIPLIDEYVDAIICFSAFPHFSDHSAVAREFYRTLKPGGVVYVLHLASRKMINRHHDGHCAVHGDHIPDDDAMRAMFLQAGFAAVTLDEKPDQYCFSAQKNGGKK